MISRWKSCPTFTGPADAVSRPRRRRSRPVAASAVVAVVVEVAAAGAESTTGAAAAAKPALSVCDGGRLRRRPFFVSDSEVAAGPIILFSSAYVTAGGRGRR